MNSYLTLRAISNDPHVVKPFLTAHIVEHPFTKVDLLDTGS